MYHEIQTNVAEHSKGLVGNSPEQIVLNIDENDMSTYSENELIMEDGEYEMNMIESTQDVEVRESKRTLIFNNCIFKNATFN